jgi:hypothetical protein
MFSLVSPLTVVFARGFGGRISLENDMAGRLKPLDVERETKPGKYADGDGLYLIVNGPTSKNWSYRYWKDGKERWHGLGSLKDVSLKEARLARDAARLRVKGDRRLPILARCSPRSSNAQRHMSASTGTVGANIAISGPHRSSGTPIRCF